MSEKAKPSASEKAKVMIRGIPKEGWKPIGAAADVDADQFRDDQRNP